MNQFILLIRHFIGSQPMHPQHKAEVASQFAHAVTVIAWLGGSAALVWAIAQLITAIN